MKSLILIATLLVAEGVFAAIDSLQPGKPAIVTIPDDVTPDMLLQLGAEPAEWELLDSLSRPSISTVEQCRGNFMPTWTLGGCKWIADGTNCTDSGMFWFNQGFSNVYALCAWDEATSACSFDREGGSTCAVTFWEPDVAAPAAAPAAGEPTLVKKPVYTTVSKHHHSTGKTEITEPLLAAMVHNKEKETREEAPVAEKKAAPAHKKIHKHNTVATAIKSAKTGKHMVAAKGKLGGKKAGHHKKRDEPEEEEYESTHEDAFIEMLAARQNAANTAAQEDFHETILNAVDTNALQQHYLQNNNIAEQNLENTATGLSNLRKNMEIQSQNDIIVGAWSEGLTDADSSLPRDLEQHDMSIEGLSPVSPLEQTTPEEQAAAFVQRQTRGYKKQW